MGLSYYGKCRLRVSMRDDDDAKLCLKICCAMNESEMGGPGSVSMQDPIFEGHRRFWPTHLQNCIPKVRAPGLYMCFVSSLANCMYFTLYARKGVGEKISEQEILDWVQFYYRPANFVTGYGIHQGPIGRHGGEMFPKDIQVDNSNDYPWIDLCSGRDGIFLKKLPKGSILEILRLLDVQPLIGVMWISAAFIDLSGFEVFDYIPDYDTVDSIGTHAMTLVGYGKEDGGEVYFICQNSWGEDWGYGGFCRVHNYIIYDFYSIEEVEKVESI